MACYGLFKSMLGCGIEAFLVLPAKTIVCFHLVKPEDADLLQPVYLSKENQRKCKEKKFKNVEERLEFLVNGYSIEIQQFSDYTHRRSRQGPWHKITAAPVQNL